MPTQILPAASLRSAKRLPATRALFLAANYLICTALWSIGRAIFRVAANFLPALREGCCPSLSPLARGEGLRGLFGRGDGRLLPAEARGVGAVDQGLGPLASKLRNGRTLLRRNWRGVEPPDALLASLQRGARAVAEADSLPELLGVEGNGAAIHFGCFGETLRSEPDAVGGFEFQNRNRRPPTDPVNAVLSFVYALLVRELNVILSAVGFDSYRGFYHQPRYGRPALALDMMEPFRPLIADSVAITVINNGEVKPGDFVYAGRACALADSGPQKGHCRL